MTVGTIVFGPSGLSHIGPAEGHGKTHMCPIHLEPSLDLICAALVRGPQGHFFVIIARLRVEGGGEVRRVRFAG